MGFIALNPSTGTLLTIAASPESGDPYIFITGNSNSKKGKSEWFVDFWNVAKASGKYWSSYDLSYENKNFTCDSWEKPKS